MKTNTIIKRYEKIPIEPSLLNTAKSSYWKYILFLKSEKNP